MRLALALSLALPIIPAEAAESCPQSTGEIATDRPDVTNSSLGLALPPTVREALA